MGQEVGGPAECLEVAYDLFHGIPRILPFDPDAAKAESKGLRRRKIRSEGVGIEDALADGRCGVTAPVRRLRWICLQERGAWCELLTNVLIEPRDGPQPKRRYRKGHKHWNSFVHFPKDRKLIER